MQTEDILLLSEGIPEVDTWEGLFSVHAESTLSALNFLEVTS